MAQVENWDQAKSEMRDAVSKLFIPIKLIDDNDDPSIPAIFALVGFGLFAASAYLWDQHWSLLFVFLIVVYLLATKTVLGKICFLLFKVRHVVSYHYWDALLPCVHRNSAV